MLKRKKIVFYCAFLITLLSSPCFSEENLLQQRINSFSHLDLPKEEWCNSVKVFQEIITSGTIDSHTDVISQILNRVDPGTFFEHCFVGPPNPLKENELAPL